MKQSSRVYEYLKGLRGVRGGFLAASFVVLALTGLSYTRAEPGKLILKSESGHAISPSETVPVEIEQGLVLSLAEQNGDQTVDIAPLDLAKVKLDPDESFAVEAVSDKPSQIRLKPKNIRFTAAEIPKKVRLTYTLQTNQQVSSAKLSIAIQPNVKVTVTVAGKNVATGGTFFITAGTTKAYTVEIKSLKNEEALPNAKLISEPKDVITETETGLKAAELPSNGDQNPAIRVRSNGTEVSQFEITATVLQKAQSIELDKQVSSLDEGTSVTLQAQLKSKDGTSLSVNESRKIVPVIDESSPKLVRIEDTGNNKFKITAALIDDEDQTLTSQPETPPASTSKPRANGSANAPSGAKPAAGAKPASGKAGARTRTAARTTGEAETPPPDATGDATPQTPPDPKPATGSTSPTNITGKNVTINFTIVQEGVPTVIGNVLKLLIEPTLGYITFTPPPVAFLLPNGNITTIAQVRDQTGKVLGNPVSFRLEDEKENAKWVVISQEGNQLNVYWNEPDESELKKADGTLKKRPSQVVVLANSFVGEHKIQSKVFVRMGEIAKFAPLKIKLNIMDQRTARDLYGGVTSYEYYVLTVRLFNNLQDEDSKQYLGSSILAYSASIEVAVGLEKRFNSKLKSDQTGVISKEKSQELRAQRTQSLKDLSDKQIEEDKNAIGKFQEQINEAVKAQREAEAEAAKRESQYQEAKLKSALGKASQEEVEAALRAAISARVSADVRLDQLIGLQSQIAKSAEARAYAFKQLVQYPDWALTVDDGKWHPMRRGDLHEIAPFIKSYPLFDRHLISETKPDDEPVCTGVVKYRPFSFEMMVNTVDRRDERGFRSRVFQLLNGLGTAASFFTAVLQPPKSNSTQLVLEKYSNLLLPALDKLFPSLKEQQRQNIVSQAMKPIEEIPFGSDITRVLFIPKKEIRGLMSGHDVRISEVCPFYFSIEVAIVKKGGVVQQGTATP